MNEWADEWLWQLSSANWSKREIASQIVAIRIRLSYIDSLIFVNYAICIVCTAL
jgi:hypothetical protein